MTQGKLWAGASLIEWTGPLPQKLCKHKLFVSINVMQLCCKIILKPAKHDKNSLKVTYFAHSEGCFDYYNQDISVLIFFKVEIMYWGV